MIAMLPKETVYVITQQIWFVQRLAAVDEWIVNAIYNASHILITR